MRASTVGELSRQSGPVKGGSRPESPPNPECFMVAASVTLTVRRCACGSVRNRVEVCVAGDHFGM